jgi:hypothetical protein
MPKPAPDPYGVARPSATRALRRVLYGEGSHFSCRMYRASTGESPDRGGPRRGAGGAVFDQEPGRAVRQVRTRRQFRRRWLGRATRRRPAWDDRSRVPRSPSLVVPAARRVRPALLVARRAHLHAAGNASRVVRGRGLPRPVRLQPSFEYIGGRRSMFSRFMREFYATSRRDDPERRCRDTHTTSCAKNEASLLGVMAELQDPLRRSPVSSRLSRS